MSQQYRVRVEMEGEIELTVLVDAGSEANARAIAVDLVHRDITVEVEESCITVEDVHLRGGTLSCEKVEK